jgi:hypothetical protein
MAPSLGHQSLGIASMRDYKRNQYLKKHTHTHTYTHTQGLQIAHHSCAGAASAHVFV